MSDIIFESSLKIVVFGLFLAIPFFLMAHHFRNRYLWITAFCISGLTLAGVIVERLVETPREQVARTLSELAQVVENNDNEKLVQFISNSKPDTQSRAVYEMQNYDFAICQTIMIHDIKIDPDNPDLASADFMVRFQLGINGNAAGGFRDVVLTFKKEGKDWRIVEYAHFNPANRSERSGWLF